VLVGLVCRVESLAATTEHCGTAHWLSDCSPQPNNHTCLNHLDRESIDLSSIERWCRLNHLFSYFKGFEYRELLSCFYFRIFRRRYVSLCPFSFLF
jgi:hypothetical protein